MSRCPGMQKCHPRPTKSLRRHSNFDPANPPPCACRTRLRDVCSTRPLRTAGPEPLHPHVAREQTRQSRPRDQHRSSLRSLQYTNSLVLNAITTLIYHRSSSSWQTLYPNSTTSKSSPVDLDLSRSPNLNFKMKLHLKVFQQARCIQV